MSIPYQDISYNTLKEFQEGRPEAFQKIFEALYQKFVFFADRIIKDHEQAEDIVSTSFLKVWENRLKVKDTRSLIAYLQMTIRNACMTHLTSQNRHRISHKEIAYLSGISAEEIQTTYIRAELLRLSWEAASALHPATKKVFHMLFEEGLSMREVAAKLGVSINTVKTQRLTAIRYLKEIASRNDWILLIYLILNWQ